MKKLNDVALKLLAKAAYANAIIFSYGQIAEKCSILHEDKRTSG